EVVSEVVGGECAPRLRDVDEFGRRAGPREAPFPGGVRGGRCQGREASGNDQRRHERGVRASTRHGPPFGARRGTYTAVRHAVKEKSPAKITSISPFDLAARSIRGAVKPTEEGHTMQLEFVRYEKWDRNSYVTINRPALTNAPHPPANEELSRV